ncbi:probable galactinol--sucrose galactosyltransferase 2 isoform X2 [Ricinus communis]|uniref:probable galactinol--sucrose galactosyltransferase 2 isoform X2 n=1 Tax=Ricinus communis TaxID=3988 RepID=UPI000772C9FB|nr:probable galactinol--sucrose galactosyltransferase 2 isoform X2 [Ricinus communis]|eukprot:XP_015578449.1 probable galactinol--sucrose galactosyltransferase 2 isoform X2 [Ricinus communis]
MPHATAITTLNMFCPTQPTSRLSSSFLTPCNANNLSLFSHKSLLRLNKNNANKWRFSMFISAKPVLKDGTLSFNGKRMLTEVPDNIFVTPLTDSSAYLGATSLETSSRHVFRLGDVRNVRLLCLFRFKMWWMIPRVGDSGRDIPIETQILLMEVTKASPDDSPSYIVFLPVLDGDFRSSLQGNSSDELEICVESGDPAIVSSECLKAVFVNHGNHPFDLMKESMKILEEQTGTFTVRESKQMPGMLDCFGWCTWDAFYHDVNPQGIKDGLRSLSEGGTPAKFLIIDDGWQNTSNEFQKEGEPFIEGSQFGGRLLSIKENHKFRKTSEALSDAPNDLKHFVSDLKSTFGLKYVYVWHALMGYWGGLAPNAEGTEKYNPKLTYPVQSPGNLANMSDISLDCMEKYGVGTIDPERISQFYDDLHSYLVSQNVDGVKVDVQNILETIAAGLGGRVSLTRQFQQALEESIAANFKDNSIICCMGQSTDSIYHAKQSAITRASDDYYPKNPATQTLHIAAVAYNSIFLGEMSLHDAAEFHAIARAVGGCGVYVSDKPGHHDFNILKKLVLPDGSVLRAKYPGRPTRDCLFSDPVMDGRSLMKIWNLNKCTGVLGAFNCQGAGSWPCMENTQQKLVSEEICGQVSPADVEYLEEVSGKLWTGDCAIYSFNKGSLCRLQKEAAFDVRLKTLECDVFTISPIKVYHQKIEFAAMGLVNMYNSGGAVEAVEQCDGGRITIRGRGEGSVGAYSSREPKHCLVNSEEAGFVFREEDNLLTVTVAPGTGNWEVHICY